MAARIREAREREEIQREIERLNRRVAALDSALPQESAFEQALGALNARIGTETAQAGWRSRR